MAVTVYKAKKETRDPKTGSIYLDRTPQQQNNQFLDNIMSAMQPGNSAAVDVSSPGGGINPQVGVAPAGASSRYSSRSSETYSPTAGGFQRREFATSPETDEYFGLMKDTEGSRPGPFKSRYEGAIQSILDGILNRKSFNLDSDPNYQRLYDQYAQAYMAQGNRAMRDQLGAAAGLTGGYGSTAAQAAASQAYDNYLQGLNNQNAQLMALAYQMYGDETADRYNQLGAVTGLDDTDYRRYRDTMSDWEADRAYYANRYDTLYGNDRRDYEYGTSMDYDQYQYESNMAYQRERDEVADDEIRYQRYQDAVNLALKYAQQGLPVPDYIAQQILDYTGAANISDVIAAMPVSVGGSGGSGRGGGRSKKETEPIQSAIDYFNSTGREKRSRFTGRQPIITPTAINARDRYIYEDVAGNVKEQTTKAKADVKGYVKKGYTVDAIIDLLFESGYSDTVIAAVLDDLKL